MLNRRLPGASAYLIIIIMVASLSGCTKPPEQPMKEDPPPVAESAPASQPAEQPGPQKTPPPPPATIAEARSAVERLYKDAVSLHTNLNPSFAVGDFNGDGSQDIAV